MRLKLSYLARTILIICSALAASAIDVRPAAAVSWSNPHHAYVVFVDPSTQADYIQEISVDPKPGPTLTLRGSKTGFGGINVLAIGPQGNLYVSGCFGSPCVQGIEIFARGASGNVAPIATLGGIQTGLINPNGMAFDSSGRLYVSQNRAHLHGQGGQVDVFAAGATGNVAPIAVIAGSNTQFRGQSLAYVAVDDAGEIFAGGTAGNWIAKFPAGANGNIAPLAVTQLQSGDGFFELQASGSSVFAAVGVLRSEVPTVYELSTSNLTQIGTLTNKRFTVLHADVDAAGKIYVQNIIRTRGGGYIGFLFEYSPGSTDPYRVRNLGRTYIGGYVVVGP